MQACEYPGGAPGIAGVRFAAFAIPFNRSIDRCDAAIAGAPRDGRCTRAPRTGNRGSIAGLSNCDETLNAKVAKHHFQITLCNGREKNWWVRAFYDLCQVPLDKIYRRRHDFQPLGGAWSRLDDYDVRSKN